MTAHKHLKQLVRSRMAWTGETYATARRQIIRKARVDESAHVESWHLPGNVPAATALRIAFAAAGVRAPPARRPQSEAMVFGLAGGIGAGCAAFLYKKEDFAS